MADRPAIVRPNVALVDPRTGMIAREWFYYILARARIDEDAAILAAFDAAIGQAAIAQLRKDTQDVRMLAEVPATPPQVSKQDLQAAMLLPLSPRQDAELAKRIDNLTVQVNGVNARNGEFSKMIADLRVLIVASAGAQRRHSAARDMARVMLRC